ncbi:MULTISPECIES: Fur family transcriptional regulator [Micrococcaceae]|uniref:Fur family transcriptional regulator n=1 Tax=unclassified Kocuria TaxID=2649579 RepID=UPI001EDE4EA8|nr:MULTISPECIES: transcriptional repressor [unclassified Kocuria]
MAAQQPAHEGSEGSAGARMTQEFRNTRQRRTVVEALDTLEEFHSAQDFHRIVSDRGGRVSLATVYRILQSLEDTGEVDVVQSDDGQALYRKCLADDHHHHLLCRRCGAAEDIEADVVEQWAEQVGSRFGFTEIAHTIELTGLCAQCTREVARSSS